MECFDLFKIEAIVRIAGISRTTLLIRLITWFIRLGAIIIIFSVFLSHLFMIQRGIKRLRILNMNNNYNYYTACVHNDSANLEIIIAIIFARIMADFNLAVAMADHHIILCFVNCRKF